MVIKERGVSGYEVLRGGQGYSTMTPQKGDIVIKKLRGGGSSSSSVSTSNVKIDGTSVIIDGLGYSVAPELQAKFIQQQTGGVGASASSAIAQANANAERIARENAQRIAVAQAQEKLNQALTLREQQRIDALKQNAKKNSATTRDKYGNIKDVTNTYYKNGYKVKEYINYVTGQTYTYTYKNGRYESMLSASDQSRSEANSIASELRTDGLVPVKNQYGQVVGFRSSDTRKTYEYSEAGINAYNEESQTGGATFRRMIRENKEYGMSYSPGDSKKSFISTLASSADKKLGGGASAVKNVIVKTLNRSGINVKNTAVANYVSKTASKLKSSGITTINKYRAFVEKRRSSALNNMSSNRPYLKKPKTYAQAVKWLFNADRWITSRTMLTAIDIGIATPQLLNQIRKNPFTTIIMLPSAIKTTFIEDFKTLKSGNPIAITELAVDYIVYTTTFNIATRGVVRTASGLKKVLPNINTRGIVRSGIKSAKKVPFVKSVIRKNIRYRKIQAKEIGKFKSAVQYSTDMKKARYIRKMARQKGRTINVGNRDFIDAVAFVEDFADRMAKIKAKKLLEKYKKAGGKLGLGKEEEFIENMRRYVNSQLNKNTRFKNLKEYAKYTEPYQIKLIKTKRIGYANKMASSITSAMKNVKFFNAGKNILRRVKLGATRIRKLPSRLKRNVIRKRRQMIRVKAFKQTNRYRMIKSRRIRKVSLDQLNQAQSINDARRLVDNVFNEIASRRNIKMGDLQFRQFKNSIKRRLEIAIKRKDVKSINQFKESVANIIRDLNKPATQPIVRVVEKGKRNYRTIKNFTPEAPRGQYVEVKSGQQVLLQEVKQVQKQVQKVYVVQSVQKQAINLRPLLKFGIMAISDLISRQMVQQLQRVKLRGDSKAITTQIFKQLQGSMLGINIAQDIEVLQAIAQKTDSGLDVRQIVIQDVASKLKTKQSLKTKQILEEKKKNLKFKLKGKLPIKVRSDGVMGVMSYSVVEKIRGKFRKLYTKPLTERDARNYAVYSIDNKLSRTALVIPLGISKFTAKLPAKIENYASKNKHKVRNYKIRYGKKRELINGYIEKRKFFRDMPGERIRRTKRTRKIIRRVSPKVTRRLMPRRRVMMKRNVVRRPARRISASQRRILLKRLKMARAVRMRNLRRR
jgi:hypothetical protein